MKLKTVHTGHAFGDYQGEKIIFRIFDNQVEEGFLEFDNKGNAYVVFEDGEKMNIVPNQFVDTYENWRKENFE